MLDRIDVLPVDKRRSTDIICTIVNAAFVILLLIIFIFTLNVGNASPI